MSRYSIPQKTWQKKHWIFKLKINASSTALQNYFNQQNLPIKDEKPINEEFRTDDANLSEFNHFKIESLFQPKNQPERLSEAEQTSLNLLFSDKDEQYTSQYMNKVKNHTAGTFLDVKG